MQRKTFTLWILLGLAITAIPWYWIFATSYLTTDPLTTPYGLPKTPDLMQHFLKAQADANLRPAVFYVYPPLTAKFCMFLAKAPYWVWHCSMTLLNVCLWAGFYLFWRRYFSNYFSIQETLVFLLFPAAIDCLRLGQNSFISIILLLLSGLALKKDQGFSAGLLIGTLFYKPQLVLPITTIFLMLKSYRAVLGSIVASIVWLGAGILFCGWESYRDWILFLQADSPATFGNMASTSIYSLFREAIVHGWPKEIKILWLGFIFLLFAGTWFWISRSAFLKQLALWERFFLLLPWASVVPLYYGAYDWLLCVPGLMLLTRYLMESNQPAVSINALAVILLPNLIYSFVFWVIEYKVPLLFLPVLLWFVLVVFLTKELSPAGKPMRSTEGEPAQYE